MPSLKTSMRASCSGLPPPGALPKRAYLRQLLVGDRSDRNGFDPGVISELLLLSSIFEEPKPDTARRAGAHAI